MPTYEIGKNVGGETFIACRICQMRSYNRNDIEQRYCGSCHQFHDIMEAAIALDPTWTPDGD